MSLTCWSCSSRVTSASLCTLNAEYRVMIIVRNIYYTPIISLELHSYSVCTHPHNKLYSGTKYPCPTTDISNQLHRSGHARQCQPYNVLLPHLTIITTTEKHRHFTTRQHNYSTSIITRTKQVWLDFSWASTVDATTRVHNTGKKTT